MRKKYENFLNQTINVQMDVNSHHFHFFKKRSNKLDTIPEDKELEIKKYEKEPPSHGCEAIYDDEFLFVTTKNIYTHRLFIEDSNQMQNRVNRRDMKIAKKYFTVFK